MHLRIIFPMTKNEHVLQYAQAFYLNKIPDVDISLGFLLNGQASIVSTYDNMLVAPEILKAVQAAENDGCDGVFLNVAFDTGLIAAKSISNIPVVGALEAAVSCAKTIAHKFSILSINQEETLVNITCAKEYDFMKQLASIEPIDMPVHELANDKDYTLSRMIEVGNRAIAAGAEALILGCTGMGWVAASLQKALKVPVLDTSLIGLYQLYMMCSLNICQSEKTFINPSNLNKLDVDDYKKLKNVTWPILQ